MGAQSSSGRLGSLMGEMYAYGEWPRMHHKYDLSNIYRAGSTLDRINKFLGEIGGALARAGRLGDDLLYHDAYTLFEEMQETNTFNKAEFWFNFFDGMNEAWRKKAA